MGATAAMVAISTSQTISASAAARRAREAECRFVVRQFDNTTATIEQKHEYASCIDELYPKQRSADEVLVLKIMFVIAIIGMVSGVVISRRDSWAGWLDHAAMAVFGFLLTPLAVIFIWWLVARTFWLFT